MAGSRGPSAARAHGQQEGGRGAEVDAHHGGGRLTQRLQQGFGVGREGAGVLPAGGPRAVAESAQVGSDHPVARGQFAEDGGPQPPGVREAVEQQHGGALPGDRDVEFGAARGDAAQLHGGRAGFVHYRLTPLGLSLESALSTVRTWAETHMHEVDEANEAHRRQQPRP